MPNANTSFTTAQKLPSDLLSSIATTESLFATGGTTITVGIPLNGLLADAQLVFRISGEVNAAVSTNVTLAVYAGSTIVSGNKIMSSGAIASGAAVNGSFIMEGDGYLSAASKTINGVVDLAFACNVAGLSGAATAFSNAVAIDPNAGGTQLFCATILFGTSNAGNTAKLFSFEIERR